MHFWLAIFLIAVMGLVLGVSGGGGSILTVPILVYVLGVEAHTAISLSLMLVGGTALTAALLHTRKARVAWKPGLFFAGIGAPLNFLGSHISRQFSGPVLLLLFGALMAVAGAAMLGRRKDPALSEKELSFWAAAVSGAAVGFMTGFLGVGGGFLIVPSLVLFLQMPMKLAAGTSLLIITVNSGVALLGHRHSLQVPGTLMLELLLSALLATSLGAKLSDKISAHHLRRAFGVFIIGLGAFMMANNAAALLRR